MTFHFSIDFVSIIIREKVPSDLKKRRQWCNCHTMAKTLGSLEPWSWQVHHWNKWQFGESWWSLRFNPTWSSSFFYPRCQHDCFTELLNFKYFFQVMFENFWRNRAYQFKLSFILKLYRAAVPQSDLGKTWTPTARTTVLVFWKLLLQTPPLRRWPQFPYELLGLLWLKLQENDMNMRHHGFLVSWSSTKSGWNIMK